MAHGSPFLFLIPILFVSVVLCCFHLSLHRLSHFSLLRFPYCSYFCSLPSASVLCVVYSFPRVGDALNMSMMDARSTGALTDHIQRLLQVHPLAPSRAPAGAVRTVEKHGYSPRCGAPRRTRYLQPRHEVIPAPPQPGHVLRLLLFLGIWFLTICIN